MIYRRYTDTSCGARSRWQSSCAAPDSVTLSSRAPQLDVPASRKNDARSWFDPAHWTVTRRGLAHATLRDVQDDRGWREAGSGFLPHALRPWKGNKTGTAPLMTFLEPQESFEVTALRYSDGRSILRSRSSTAAPSERAALRRCAAAGVEPQTTASEGAH